MNNNARSSVSVVGSNVTNGELSSRKLARGHYENFNIAAFITPKRLRQDLYNIYAFCRLADDIADEKSCQVLISDTTNNDDKKSSELLSRWEENLEAAALGKADDPVFSALSCTIDRNNLNLEPFRRLLAAFRMDLVQKRWETWDDLRYYTRHSADPVGHIVLELFGYDNPDFFALSDKICTALQLANHWQDVQEDFNRGRIYIPQEDMKKFNVCEEEIEQLLCQVLTPDTTSQRFKELMTFEVKRAQRLFLEGLPLLSMVDKRLRFQLALSWCGGMEALNAIKRIDYDVLNRSAKLTTGNKIKVVFNSMIKWILPFN